MGEIGCDRKEYLYDLTLCDLLLIEKGYERRYRHLWSTTRWSTFYTMIATCGGENLSKNGIHKPMDLIKFPWECEERISEADVKELQSLIEQANKEDVVRE